MVNAKSLGERLRAERDAKFMKQEEIAAIGGKSTNMVIEYEKGRTLPSTDFLLKLHEHGIDIGYVLTGARSGEPQSAENGRFLSQYMQLGGRERHAIARLVEGLIGPAPAHGSVAQILEHDGMGHLLDEARGTLHDPAVPFSGKRA